MKLDLKWEKGGVIYKAAPYFVGREEGEGINEKTRKLERDKSRNRDRLAYEREQKKKRTGSPKRTKDTYLSKNNRQKIECSVLPARKIRSHVHKRR